MTCAVCGAQNDATALFCYRCGSSLKATDIPAADAPATGATVNLGSRATPAFGSPVLDLAPEEPAHARVYDVPAAMPAAMPGAPPSYTPPAYNPAPGGMGHGTAVAQQNNLALIAMILGIVSFLGPSLLCAIPAIFLGRKARQEIVASGGTMTGDGMAQAGIILGWVNTALSLVLFCAICVLPFLTLLGVSTAP